MDPTTNPTPTPTPTPTPEPTPATPPVPAEPAAPAAPATPPAPAAPVTPPAPAAPVSVPEPLADAPALNAQSAPSPAGPAVNPVINPAATSPFVQQNGVAATDPIMMPEPAKAPDPIEEELKAPMKAAAPAPGSIGSAVSGPADSTPADAAQPVDNPFAKNNTPNVAFNDPAAAPDGTPAAPAPAKKKTNKNTLIALIVVSVMIVIALAAVLIMQFMNGQPSSTPPANNQSSSNSNSSSTVQPDVEEEVSENTTNSSDLTCTNSITYSENGATYKAGVGSAQTVYSYAFAGGELTSVAVDRTITHTDGTTETSSNTLTVDEYRARAGFTPEDALSISSIIENFETNVNNFVTDTTVNSDDVTNVTNSCNEA